MKLPPAPAATTAHASAWAVGALLSLSLTVAPPAFAAAELEYSEGGAYQGSKIGQDQQFKAGVGKGAEKAENSKIQGGGASTLQGGRRITITRGVNLDNTIWKGENLKGVAFQQSVVRSADFEGSDLRTASFFDADLSNSNFKDANMVETNLEMADLTGADLTGADLTNAYMTGAVVNGPKGGLTKIDNTDWTDAQLRKDQRTYLCSIAKGIPSCCTAPAGREHSLFTPACLSRREPQDGRGDAHELDVQGVRRALIAVASYEPEPNGRTGGARAGALPAGAAPDMSHDRPRRDTVLIESIATDKKSEPNLQKNTSAACGYRAAHIRAFL